MCFVEVPVELDSDDKDDIIEKAILSFKIKHLDNNGVYLGIEVQGLNGHQTELFCEGIWDDYELMTIQEDETNS